MITNGGDATGAPFGRTVATLALVGMVVVGQMYVTIPLMPQIGVAWRISQEAATWATSAFALGYAVGSLTSGYLSKRHDIRALMAGSIVVMAFVTVLVPFATGLGGGSVLRATQGFLAGTFLPMAYSYLNARIPSRRLPLALTTVSCALGGTVVTGQAQAQLLTAGFGWRSVFWLTAPLLVLGAVVVWKVLLPGPGGRPAAAALRGTSGFRRLIPLYLVALVVAGSLTGIYTGVQLYGPGQLVGDHGAMLALRASALPGLLVTVLLAPVLGAVAALLRAAGGFVVAGVGMLAAVVFVDSAVGLGAALLVFVMGISVVSPAIVQTVGAAAGARQSVAIALYDLMLNLGSAAGVHLPSLLPDLADLAALLAGITGVGAVIVLVSVVLSRRRGPVRHSTS
jgi:predicted MFS family arabinose efflux permease